MTEKLKIKVIKKDAIKAPAKMERSDIKTKRAVAREMVSTVSNWVTDFQIRKRDETKLAIEKFLIQKPQTAGS